MILPSFLRPRTLQQRNMLHLILPTLIVLLLMGLVSLLLVRQVLIQQWEQTTIARMQRAAYEIDMRLMRPKRLLMLFQEQSNERFNRQISQFILERLNNLEGVVGVELVWNDEEKKGTSLSDTNSIGRPHVGSRSYHKMKPLEVSPPIYDAEFENATISLVSEFKDKEDSVVGHIEVRVSFYDMIGSMVNANWWVNNRAFLVDQAGNILTRTALIDRKDVVDAVNKFGTASELEKKTLKGLQENASGAVFGRGMPPDEVSGYYRLHEAPWTMVVIEDGALALQQIITFRRYYFITGAVGIFLALLLIKATSSGTAKSIRRVSDAARELAKGNFSGPLEEDRLDEVGELTQNFNIMTRQLKERLTLQEAMGVAREVQQNLLPQSSYRGDGIDISGCSVYCDETGGDYFDILPDQHNSQKIRIVVGDVVGHGIGAALLMASIRSIVRCRTSLPGNAVEVIADVNKLLCRDTERSGSFVTLFYLVLELDEELIRWVRCGHDPAIVFDCRTEQFSELRGEGLVLGFDSDWVYQENSLAIGGQDLILLLGSDGVWEAENMDGELFGRARVKQIISDNRHASSEEIAKNITEEVAIFRGEKAQGDDITLVVVKTEGME